MLVDWLVDWIIYIVREFWVALLILGFLVAGAIAINVFA